MTRVRWTVLVVAGWVIGCSAGSSGGDNASSSGGGGVQDAGQMVDCTGRPTAAPTVRSELGGFWDDASGRMFIYGGNLAVATACNVPPGNLTAEMWVFHSDCANWEALPAGGPGARARFGSAVDSTRNRYLVFGGRTRPGSSYVNKNDTWAYDVATGTWSEIVTSGTAPTAVSSPAMAYDAVTDSLLVFGGNSSTSGLSLVGTDGFFVLALATGTWTQVTAAGAPSPRLYHSATIVGREFVVYGGTPNFDGPYLRDAFAYNIDTATWRTVATGAGPDARFGAELFPDAARNRVVAFAGHDDAAQGMRNDAWALDLGTGTWTTLRPGDQLNNTNVGQCDFPADFTAPESGAPERRYSFVRAHGAGAGYVFGGKTDCGAVNDVWRFNLDTDTWTSLRPTSGGESCLRSGNLNCSGLCF